MPRYDFFGPAGEKFSIDVPVGTSPAQARVFFQEQLSTGALKNLSIGKTLDAAVQSKSLTKVLDTSNQALPQGIVDAASYVKQGAATLKVGSINTAQVTGLLAQAQSISGQAADQLTNVGVGKFAITPAQLETSGLIKPGTVQQFLQDPSDTVSVLNSPSVWTGRQGANSVESLLSDTVLQDRIQQQLMNSSLADLQKLGVVDGQESPIELAPLIQASTKFGAETTAEWTQGLAPANTVNSINGIAKGAQYAVKFVDEKLPDALTSGARIGGFTDTVDRGLLDANVGLIIDNPKIPSPNFGQSIMSSSREEDLEYTGDDPIVWDRVNAERSRRGLPGLAAIGYPRPSDDTV